MGFVRSTTAYFKIQGEGGDEDEATMMEVEGATEMDGSLMEGEGNTMTSLDGKLIVVFLVSLSCYSEFYLFSR